MFFSDAGQTEDDGNYEGQYFSAEYWRVLSPVLTKLYLVIMADEIFIKSDAWLNSMQKLQHLEINGQFSHPRIIPLLALQNQLPAVKMCHSHHCKLAS